jgi:hypothetical protein
MVSAASAAMSLPFASTCNPAKSKARFKRARIGSYRSGVRMYASGFIE